MRFALAGNPNSGKTTLFNALTGSRARVGNWPGVTVEKRSGTYKKSIEKPEIVDLPGIYSLSPYTDEEKVARAYLMEEKPDCIINIVDATSIERGLYFTSQLMELDIPIVVTLNMMDEVERDGGKIDLKSLEAAFKVPIFPISALKKRGIEALMAGAVAAAKEKRKGDSVLYQSRVGGLLKDAKELCEKKGVAHPTFHAIKIIEGDELEVKDHPDIKIKIAYGRSAVDAKLFDGDFAGVIADERFRFITPQIAKSVKKPEVKKGGTKSERIDKVLTHKIWGIPIFALIMLAIFHVAFSENFLFLGIFFPEGSFDSAIFGTDALNSPGVILLHLVEELAALVSGGLSSVMPEGVWYTSLICDGILEGVFAVLTFVPQILVLFLCLSILEDSGYMARVAFILDRAFRRFGLSGKAIMPLIMFFGCGVPGIMATKTLNSDGERRRTIFIAPFFTCGAKLPIWAAFGGVFASVYAGLSAELVVFSMYFLGIAVAVIATLFLKRTFIKSDNPNFIMELPSYRVPSVKTTLIFLWEKLKHYLIRAGTIIAGAVVIIWFLISFNFSFQMVDAEESILGVIAKGITWLFVPLGFGLGENAWKFVVTVFTGLIAKEMVVATMGVFAGVEDALDLDTSAMGETAMGAMMLTIGGALGGMSVAIPAMFAFMAFNLLSVPCMAAVAAAKSELNSKKWLFGAVAFWFATAYVVSAVVFWVGVLFALAWWAGLLGVIGLVGILVGVYFLLGKRKGFKKQDEL
ncbi:MAG: ferrous iron transport protein B, partial [Clostridiales bacterium]|nr:ferrous iron transport protein B [Clostridiales bacterium]